MSVTDPLLKELKSCTIKLVQDPGKTEIDDDNVHLQPFCQCLEQILQKGLLFRSSSLGFTKKPESWYWLAEVAKKEKGASFNYTSSVDTVKSSLKIKTPNGRLRSLIRTCLVNKCLHVPVEILVRNKQSGTVYTAKNSIIGDDILGEIFLSVLLQCSRLTFKLNLNNCAFLDDTWLLPSCEQIEFVPCKKLGIIINFVSGKAVIIAIKETSVAAEDDKIQIGDILDELNGVHISSNTRNKLDKIMKKANSQPLIVNIIKAHYNGSDTLYPPIINLLHRAHIDPNDLHSNQTGNSNKPEDQCTGKKRSTVLRPGFSVTYIGSSSTGREGDVKQVERAMVTLFGGGAERVKQPALFEIQEMGIRVIERDTGEILLKYSYMEISSCGTALKFPNYFAFIAGNENCSVARSFTCFVFQCSDEEQIQSILQSMSQGFQRTHFAV